MQAVLRAIAGCLLLLAFQPALAVVAGHCTTTLSEEQQRYLDACLRRGAQCTDYWPGYPEDLQDCERLRKWLAKASTMPQPMRDEIFGTVPAPDSAGTQTPQAAANTADAPWKNLPRSQEGSAPRPVANNVAGATAADYAGASSQLDPEQAKAAGLAFWTGQILQIADIVTEANRSPVPKPRTVTPPATTAGNVASNPPPAATASAANRREEIVYQNHQNATNANCVELRGNHMANKCGETLLIAFCVTSPQQTKNFFDASDAMACGSGGGLDNIHAGKSHGLVLYGVIQYFACPYTDYYTPARMKTKLSPQGYYWGTCGNDGGFTGGKVGWTMGGTLLSHQPK